MLLGVHCLIRFKELVDIFCQYFFHYFYSMWCKGYRTVVIAMVPGATIVYWCNNGSSKIYWYCPVFFEVSCSNLRWWARLLLHCLRSNAGNSSGPPDEFWEIVFITFMMSSLVILISDSVLACGCPKKFFGYLIVIVVSTVMKTL